MGRLFISLVVVFVVAGGLLIYQATSGTSSLVLLPTELIGRAKLGKLERIRVSGRVVEPIRYQIEPTIELAFLIENPKPQGAPEGPVGQTVPVIYRGVKPDMFIAGRDVLIDGDFDGKTIIASKVLTQCPSKYEPAQAPHPTKP